MSITDSRIRAAVWAGAEDWRDHGRRWYVDVYYAARRSPALRVILRAELDADPDTEVIRRDFATRLEALAYAAHVIAAMRLTAALAVGTIPSAEMLDGLSTRAARMFGNPPHETRETP